MLIKSKKKGLLLATARPMYAAASGGGGSPTLAYIGGGQPTYVGNVATLSGASIGTASSDRLVVVVAFDINDGANSTALMTIGGNAATVNAVANSTFNPLIAIGSLLVPSGPTANIVVTWGSAGGFGNFQVYTITGLSSTTPVGASANWDGSANPISTTIATSSGGVIIVGGSQTSIGSPPTISGTESFSADTGNINVGSVGVTGAGVSHATGTATNASSVVTATWASSASHTSVVAASWR